MKKISQIVYFLFVLLVFSSLKGCTQNKQSSKPNIVNIFTDDQGYEDLGCFRSENTKTLHIDKMAPEGVKLTNFYVAAPLYSPSRAGLMTGCYPKGIGIPYGSNFPVLLAADTNELNPDEIMLAEVLKEEGYSTGIFGKWHLGDLKEFLPTHQGFDEFYGLLYSWDIDPFNPNQKDSSNPKFHWPPLPLLEGDNVIKIESPKDMDSLTHRIPKKAVGLIKKHENAPFFLYVPHFLPHRPIHISPDFMGNVPDSLQKIIQKENGYVDYKIRDLIYLLGINEIDWSVGQILNALKEYGIDNNTLVVYISDNGPANIGIGSAGPLRGFKGSMYEGVMREPTIVRWPDKIPSSLVSSEMVTAMDLYPTLIKLAGRQLPNDRIIDCKDIWQVLTDKGKSPYEAFFYYKEEALNVVRAGKWKLHLRVDIPTELYNLENDISESQNVLEQNPAVVKQLLILWLLRKTLKQISALRLTLKILSLLH